MLRVYSILYIERLWTVDATPTLKAVESSHSSILERAISVPVEEIVIVEEEDDKISVLMENENVESPILLDGVPEEEEVEEETQEIQEIEEIEEPFSNYTLETMEIEQVTSSSEDESGPEETKRLSKVTFEEPPHEEHVVKSLAINTDREEYVAISESTISEEFDASSHEEEEEEVAAASVSSASSSIVPPHTPPSTHASGNSDKPTSPRTTSLLRRETSKLNSRRKSLTNKLKRVLTVKGGATNKRNSVSLE